MSIIEPKITIIIPVYNVSQYIVQCIRSIKAQTYNNFKIIIINDGSTDDSWEKAVGLLHDDQRAVFVSKQNEGLGPTRNLGIRIADTEFVTFLDSDDWWREDYIEKMMVGVDSGADIILGDYYFFDQFDDGSDKTTVSAIRLDKGLITVLSEDNILSKARNFASGKVFRKKMFIDNNLWFPSHPYEDVSLMTYIVSCAEKLYCVGDPLYYYRRNRAGSIRSDISTLRYIAISVDELYSRFITSRKLLFYKRQIRQFFWGQYCFVNKWLRSNQGRIQDKEAEDIVKSISDVCFYRFPELKNFSKGKIYADGEDLVLQKALRCIVFDADNITSDRNVADYIVINGSDKFEGDVGKVLCVTLPYDESDVDNDTMVWNIAEEIMGQL